MAAASEESGKSHSSPAEDRSEALVRRAQGGEPEAVDALIGAHLDDVRAFVRLQVDPRIRARESSSDIVQSVCKEVLQDLGRFEYRGVGSFRAWLFTAALNKVRAKGRFHRAQRRDVARDLSPDAGDKSGVELYASLCTLGPPPLEEAIAREEAERIERAMDRLPEDERQVLLLARVAGLSHREIAPRLGRTERAVRSLVQRASVRLLAALEGRSRASSDKSESSDSDDDRSVDQLAEQF